MTRYILSATGLILLTTLSGCFDQGQTPDGGPAAAETPPISDAHPFDARLLEIARNYDTYGRVDASYRWAPTLCASPPSTPTPHFSASQDEGTHGRKLYSLFARERPGGQYSSGYTPASGPCPVGQVVVKEAWVPEEVQDDGKPLEPVARKVKVRENGELVESTESFLPYVRKDGHVYHAARKAGLFIMVKTDPKTPGTDEGWVYGTTTADGTRVTSAGRVESCMACHREAPHDRLFGLRQE